MKRLIASNTIVKQSASRKTVLIFAPTTSARTQPYVFISDRCREIRTATVAITSDITSDNM